MFDFIFHGSAKDFWGSDDDDDHYHEDSLDFCEQTYIDKTEIFDFKFYPQIRINENGEKEVFFGSLFGNGMKTTPLETRYYSENAIRAEEYDMGIPSAYEQSMTVDQTDRGNDIVENQTWKEVFDV
jgi:hypothetical protein